MVVATLLIYHLQERRVFTTERRIFLNALCSSRTSFVNKHILGYLNAYIILKNTSIKNLKSIYGTFNKGSLKQTYACGLR